MANGIFGNIISLRKNREQVEPAVDDQLAVAQFEDNAQATDQVSEYEEVTSSSLIETSQRQPGAMWSMDGVALEDSFPMVQPEFDIAVAGIKYGIEYNELTGQLSLKEPTNTAMLPEEHGKLDMTGVWSENLVPDYGDVYQLDFDLASELKTPLRQLLWLLCYQELVPLLNIYKNDPEALAYAGAIFNAIVGGLEKASRLGDTIYDSQREPIDFLQAIQNHYVDPAISNEIMPLARVNVDRIMLGRVDDRQILFGQKLDDVNLLTEEANELRQQMVMLDANERELAIKRHARTWSEYLYNDHVLTGPVPGNLLPSELEAALPKSFDKRDSRKLYNQLVPYENPRMEIPKNASEILSEFSQGLKNIIACLDRITVPLEFQFIGGSFSLINSEDQIMLDSGEVADVLCDIPTTEDAINYAEDNFYDVVRVSDDMKLFEADTEIELGQEMLVLQESFYNGWDEVVLKIKDIGNKSYLEMTDDVYEDVWLNCYGNWAYQFINVLFGRQSIYALWDNVQKRVKLIEEIDGQRIFVRADGSSMTGSELKDFYRAMLMATFEKFSQILTKSQMSVFGFADQNYQDISERKAAVCKLKHNYERSLWFFQTMSEIYNGYIQNSKREFPNVNAESIAKNSPFMQAIRQESQELTTVLDSAIKVSSLVTDDPTVGFFEWQEFDSFSSQLDQELGTDLTAVIVSYLKGNESDEVFFKELSLWSDSTSSDNIFSLKSLLMNSYPQLELTTWNQFASEHGLNFLNRMRSFINCVIYFEEYKAKCSQRVNLSLVGETEKGLIEWYAIAPYGWPGPEGKTPEGIKLEYDFNPNPDYYLSFENVLYALSPESYMDEDNTIEALTLFFADYKEGYIRYFLAGGFEYNSHGEAIRFSKSYVYVHQLEVVLDDIAKIAQAQLEQDDFKTSEEKAYAQKIKTVCRQVLYNLKAELSKTRTNLAYNPVMKDSHTYNGIVPTNLDQSLEPVVSFGPKREALDISVTHIIERAKRNADEVVSEYADNFSLSQVLPANEDDKRIRYGFFEEYMSLCKKPDKSDYYTWTIRSAGLYEMQYIMGRLWDIATINDENELRQKHYKIITTVLRTDVGLVKKLPAQLEQGTYQETSVVLEYPDALANMLLMLTPSEALWLAGYLRKRILVSDAFDKDENLIKFFYEEQRQADLDEYLLSLKKNDAIELLVQLFGRYDVNDDYIAEVKRHRVSSELYFEYDEALDDSQDELAQSVDKGMPQQITASLKKSYQTRGIEAEQRNKEKIFILCNGDDLREKSHRPDILTRLELLYLTTLLAKDLNVTEIDNTDELKNELEAHGSDLFQLNRVMSVYSQIPEDDKDVYYAFIYYQSWGYYIGGVNESLMWAENVFSMTINEEECRLWDVLASVPDTVLDKPAAQSSESNLIFNLNQTDLAIIIAAWKNHGLKPQIPVNAQANPEELALFLKAQMENSGFFKNNQVVFANFILPKSKMPAEEQAAFWTKLTTNNELSDQDIRMANLQLLKAINPLMSVEVQKRQDQKEMIDESIAEVLESWADVEDINIIKMDPKTQVLVLKTLDELIALYTYAGADDSQYLAVADAYMAIKEIMLGQFDTSDPVARSMFSKYNPAGNAQARQIPSDIALLYSRDYYKRISDNSDPYLMLGVEPVLKTVFDLVEGDLSEESFRRFVASQDDYKNLEAFLEHFDSVYKPYTIAFYEMHDFDRVPDVTKKMVLVEEQLNRQIAMLKPTPVHVLGANDQGGSQMIETSFIRQQLEGDYE